MRTFRKGGIHPEENKFAREVEIEEFPLPVEGIVFLHQHLGAPANPIVEKGDSVKVGQLIAEASGFISANIHSPYSGKVKKIDSATDISGYKKPAIYIEIEGDEWLEEIDRSNDLIKNISLDSRQIIDKIKEKGIVGLGGAAFPTHIKYLIPEDKTAEYLIINAAECEPYLTSDYRIMLERAEEAFVGVEIIKKALNVDKAFIGIENNKPEAIEAMREVAKDYKGIEVVPLKTKYPQGAEKQLINAITKREVPSGKLPIEVGCVVNNISTALAVYEAVQKNKPLIDNIITITGKGLNYQKNILVRVGTPLNSILDYYGGMPENTGKLISGGPMMGKAITEINSPTTKTTSSILIMTKEESKRKRITNCIRCGKCIGVCPMGLEPILIAQYAESRLWEETEKHGAMDCIECGSCLFTCPAGRPLLDMIRVSKIHIGNIRRERAAK